MSRPAVKEISRPAVKEEYVYGRLLYNKTEEVGELELSLDLTEKAMIIQLDLLQDWITCLTKTYNEMVHESLSAYKDGESEDD